MLQLPQKVKKTVRIQHDLQDVSNVVGISDAVNSLVYMISFSDHLGKLSDMYSRRLLLCASLNPNSWHSWDL